MSEIVTGPEGIALGAQRLRAGALVAFPTETVYGLGADALNADAVAKVFSLKGRPSNNPLIVHVCESSMAKRVVDGWTDDATKLADAFWPGPLTLVLRRASCVPDVVTGNGSTVAVRCPEHPVALALIESFGNPIVGPSANPSGYISPTIPEHVRDAFDAEDLIVLDGGHCRTGIESTVLDLSREIPCILRPGVIGAHRISDVLGVDVQTHPIETEPGETRSPGVIGAHYQPGTPARIVSRDALSTTPSSAVLLSWSIESHPNGGEIVVMPSSIGLYARAMYRALHEADRLPGTEIWIESPPLPETDDDRAISSALRERLQRATHA